ncbi:hypothetical protein GDO86_011970 [Hymenochirus boettgeri]|uniref:MADF domain-containing protein n=2 Tax=Hymenochirus boettgeri TaxID=247094 RepID=A0A8T2JIP4_9PIPI|nr:hypothetical protein GDO86_011970 [Hymenochirus boettgeri]
MKPECLEIKQEEEEPDSDDHMMESSAVRLTDGGFLDCDSKVLAIKVKEEEEPTYYEDMSQMESSGLLINYRGAYCGEMIMSPENTMTPDFLKEFIRVYRSLPCLWKVKSADYFNKQKKYQAYEILLELCRSVFPIANIEFVKHKIANLRTVFKKELKKVELSRKSGATPENIYVPRLWYFELLKFTIDQEIPKRSNSNIMETQEGHSWDEREEETRVSDVSFETVEVPNLSQVSVQSQNEVVENEMDECVNQKKMKKRKIFDEDIGKQLLSQAAALLNKTEDEYDNFGFVVASKLRKMEESQRLAAEMIVYDVLHKGMLKQLNVQNPIGCYVGQEP